MSLQDRLRFMGLQEEDTSVCFQVVLPVFSIDDVTGTDRVGTCQLLVDMDFLASSISHILPNEDYFCLLTEVNDGEETVLLRRGDEPEGLLDADVQETMLRDQTLYRTRLNRTDWDFLFGVPQRELYANINSLQHHYNLSMLVLILLIFSLLFGSLPGRLRDIR